MGQVEGQAQSSDWYIFKIFKCYFFIIFKKYAYIYLLGCVSVSCGAQPR